MKSNIVIEGQKFYDEHLKAILEPEHIGKFVSIETESGQYFVGKTDVEAMKKSKSAIPNKIKCLLRIGHKFTYNFSGGYGKKG